SIRVLLALVLWAGVGSTEAQRVLDTRRHHLGIAGRPEWDEFARDLPVDRELSLTFEGQANTREATLLIRQDNVKLDWPVRLNARPIGRLLPMEATLVHALPVPPGALRDGVNTLVIASPGQADDIVIDRIELDPRPLRAAVGRTTLDVSVTDAESGAALP